MELRERAEESQQLAQEVSHHEVGMLHTYTACNGILLCMYVTE